MYSQLPRYSRSQFRTLIYRFSHLCARTILKYTPSTFHPPPHQGASTFTAVPSGSLHHSSVLHRLLKQPPQLLTLLPHLLTQRRRQHQHPSLRQRPLHQPIHMLRPKAQRPQPPRLIPQSHQELRQGLTEHLPGALPLHVTDIRAEYLRGR